MKKTIVFLIMIGFAVTLSAQNLVNLALVEKARRLSLGGRHGPVVTNADLFRVKIRPAVEVIVPEEEITEGLPEGAEAGEAATAGTGAPGTQVTAPPAGEAATARVVSEPEAEAEPTPEEKLKTTEDLVDLLETKIAALNQDYRSQTNMMPNYVIEQQLTETLKRLQSAQADATRLRMEIERKRLEKRAGAAPIR